MVCFSVIQKFPDFLETFPGCFHIIFPRFEISEIFGWMKSALSYKSKKQYIELYFWNFHLSYY